MSQYRHRLPQLEDTLFLTDGELENSLSLQGGLDVPGLAAFDLLQRAAGRSALQRYYAQYAALARSHAIGLVLESATMRVNPDWGAVLGYDAAALAHVQRTAIDLLVEIRSAFQSPDTAIVISGNVGPRTDGYNPALCMSAYEAAHYHAPRIETFAQTAMDMLTARSMSYVEEASGIALVASAYSVPVVISLKPGSSGRLHSGDTLAQAIERIDAESRRYPAYYMIECSHAVHLAELLGNGGTWLQRVRGVRMTRDYSRMNAGNADALAAQYWRIRELLPQLAVLGVDYDRLEITAPATNATSAVSDAAAASQVYSTEFVIRSKAGHSGAALTRSAHSSTGGLRASLLG
jgi:S-methylmethionine-dependent homocysteine/selenocysteine methylase